MKKTRVIFYVEPFTEGKGILAVFPDAIEKGVGYGAEYACFSHVGQHSTTSREYLEQCSPANALQWDDLHKELEGYPYRYNLEIVGTGYWSATDETFEVTDILKDPIQELVISPVQFLADEDTGEEYTKSIGIADEDAHAFGIYSGHTEWLADCKTRAGAEKLVAFIYAIATKGSTASRNVTKEVAQVAAIIADNFSKELYELAPEGYISMLDEISEYAMSFVEQHKDIVWEDFYETEAAFNAQSWDDYVIAWTENKVEELENNKFRIVTTEEFINRDKAIELALKEGRPFQDEVVVVRSTFNKNRPVKYAMRYLGHNGFAQLYERK